MDEVKQIRLLVVDDNPGDADMLMDIFHNSNDVAVYGAYELEAQWVKNLEEAGERLKQFKYDIIFQNLNLNDVEGRSTLKAMKAIAQDTPIIVTTEYINRKLWQEAFLEGAQDFILKNSIDNAQLVIKTIFYTL